MRQGDTTNEYVRIRARENLFGYLLMTAGVFLASFEVWSASKSEAVSPNWMVLVFAAGLMTLGGMFVNASVVKAWARAILPFLRKGGPEQ